MKIITDLFGYRPDCETIPLQVDRYKKEWLELEPFLDHDEARREVFWKIDDPIINVYSEWQVQVPVFQAFFAIDC